MIGRNPNKRTISSSLNVRDVIAAGGREPALAANFGQTVVKQAASFAHLIKDRIRIRFEPHVFIPPAII